MSYKIILDSCGELPPKYKADERFEIVSLGIEVGDYQIMDDENFNQKEFLAKVAACPKCPKSSCPSPESYMEACHCDADHVYIVTLSSKLSGSYNSAVLGKNLYHEKYGDKDIHVCDSQSASCGRLRSRSGRWRWKKKGVLLRKLSKNWRNSETALRLFLYWIIWRRSGRMGDCPA